MHPMLSTAVKAARRAGSIINRGARDLDRLTITAKGPKDFVSEVDRAADLYVSDMAEPEGRPISRTAALSTLTALSTGNEEDRTTNASLVDSSSSLTKALAATLPPRGAGQSSISGAAGEVAHLWPRFLPDVMTCYR